MHEADSGLAVRVFTHHAVPTYRRCQRPYLFNDCLQFGCINTRQIIGAKGLQFGEDESHIVLIARFKTCSHRPGHTQADEAQRITKRFSVALPLTHQCLSYPQAPYGFTCR